MRPRKRHGNHRTVQTNLSRTSGVRFLGEVSQTRSNHWEHNQEGERLGGRTTRHGRSSHHPRPQLYFLSSPPLDAGNYTTYLFKSVTWTADLSALPSTTGYCWKAVEMSAQQIGVPSTKSRTFVACVRNHPSAEEGLIRWKARLTDMTVQPVTLDEFIGGEGSYFLNRKKDEQRIPSFEDSTFSLTRGQILGEKPTSSGYQPHSSDVSSLEDAQDLHLADFAKIARVVKGTPSHPHSTGAPLPPSLSAPPRAG